MGKMRILQVNGAVVVRTEVSDEAAHQRFVNSLFYFAALGTGDGSEAAVGGDSSEGTVGNADSAQRVSDNGGSLRRTAAGDCLIHYSDSYISSASLSVCGTPSHFS